MVTYSKYKMKEIESRNRQIVKLRDELGMSYREISRIIGLTHETCRNIYCSEQKKIRKTLDK